MLSPRPPLLPNPANQPGQPQRGATMIEVLITIVILAFGLLGLAVMQSKMQLGQVEAFQRAQAIVLLAAITDRITANVDRSSANIATSIAAYASANSLGTGDTAPTDCSTQTSTAAKDRCEWSNILKGSSETLASANVGAMVDARACITQLQAPNLATGSCAPGILLVQVAWQGNHKTATRSSASTETCGKDQYGTDDGFRRVISQRLSIGVPYCQ